MSFHVGFEVGADAELVVDDHPAHLQPELLRPLREMLKFQPFIGGEAPLFHDYVVFGSLQWARVASPFTILSEGDPVADWFARCLALHDGLGLKTRAAA